jgi:Tfp pilus assembly protein PilF
MPTASTLKAAANAADKRSQYDSPKPRLKLASATSPEQCDAHEEARQRDDTRSSPDAKAVDAVLGLARLDQLGGRNVEAEAGYRRAVRMGNASVRTLDALGQFYADRQRWNDAIATLQKASAAAPYDNTVRFHYAIALARSGQINQATPLLQSVMEPADVHYNLGVILREQGDLAGSEQQFTLALRENPYLEPAEQWLAEVRRERDLEFANAARRNLAATAANSELWDSHR